MKKLFISTIIALLVLGVLAGTAFAERPAEAGRPCPAPGGGYAGALNMLHDATMWTIPMARDAPQGNEGMFRAVEVSGC